MCSICTSCILHRMPRLTHESTAKRHSRSSRVSFCAWDTRSNNVQSSFPLYQSWHGVVVEVADQEDPKVYDARTDAGLAARRGAYRHPDLPYMVLQLRHQLSQGQPSDISLILRSNHRFLWAGTGSRGRLSVSGHLRLSGYGARDRRWRWGN